MFRLNWGRAEGSNSTGHSTYRNWRQPIRVWCRVQPGQANRQVVDQDGFIGVRREVEANAGKPITSRIVGTDVCDLTERKGVAHTSHIQRVVIQFPPSQLGGEYRVRSGTRYCQSSDW